jgi:putative serine protease PepD
MRGWMGTVVTAAAGGALTTALLLASGTLETRDAAVAGDPPLAARGQLVASAANDGALSAREIYERAAPAVVSVRARVLPAERTPYGAVEAHSAATAGSGFVLDAEKGLVVCSAHTVAAATDIAVGLAGGRMVPARALGSDDDTDLALLAVDADGLGLRELELAEGGVEVGDPILALAKPGPGAPTLATGVVSSPGRRLMADGGFTVDRAIRTDAPQVPGDTGGPLLDAAGRVIGATAHLTVGGAVVGFAVPADTIAQVVPALEESGRVRRAFLGVRTAAASGGVRVAGVREGSPAAAAGVRPGDTLRRIDGSRVRSVDDLSRVLAGLRPGALVPVEITRGKERSARGVRLADRPGGTADR